MRGNFFARVDSLEVVDRLEVQPFRLTEDGIHYTVLLSVSGRLERALFYREAAILTVVDAMQDNDLLSVYTVGSEALPVFEFVRRDDVDAQLIRDIVTTEDSPNLIDSITGMVMRTRNIPEEARETIQRQVAIVISDGRDVDSRFDRETLLRRASEASIPIYSLGISVFGANLEFLNGISDQTGGSYQFVSQAQYDQIADRVGRMMRQVQQGYVLTFRVTEIPADDDFHQLMIGVAEREAELNSYKNFIAVRVPFPLWLRITLAAAAAVFLIVLVIVLIIHRRRERKKMGITKRKCPDCKRRMKDDWEFCPFCKYLPSKKKRRKNKEEEAA